MYGPETHEVLATYFSIKDAAIDGCQLCDLIRQVCDVGFDDPDYPIQTSLKVTVEPQELKILPAYIMAVWRRNGDNSEDTSRTFMRHQKFFPDHPIVDTNVLDYGYVSFCILPGKVTSASRILKLGI